MTATPYTKQTWIDGDTSKPVSAARLGHLETGVFDAHYRPSCRVYSSIAISVANVTHVAPAFDSERYDTDGMHSTGTNPSRITIQTPGIYLVSAMIAFAPNVTGQRLVSIVRGGTITLAAHSENAVAGGFNHLIALSTVDLFSAGDYIELDVFQSSGGALNVLASGNFSPEFAATLVSY